MSELADFDKLLATLEQEMAQVQSSPEIHISFRDGRNLITVCEQDPAFRDVIVEYYRHRIESMHRWRGDEQQDDGGEPGECEWELTSLSNGIDPHMGVDFQ